MAYAASELALPSSATPRLNIGALPLSIAKAIGESLRKRWIYQRTLSDLEGYSEHALLDLGAPYGAEEFARRAAGY